MNITLNNLSVKEDVPVEVSFAELKPAEVTAAILTQEMHAHNTFEEPETVGVQGFDGVQAAKEGISFTIPACSVLHIAVK